MIHREKHKGIWKMLSGTVLKYWFRSTVWVYWNDFLIWVWNQTLLILLNENLSDPVSQNLFCLIHTMKHKYILFIVAQDYKDKYKVTFERLKIVTFCLQFKYIKLINYRNVFVNQISDDLDDNLSSSLGLKVLICCVGKSIWSYLLSLRAKTYKIWIQIKNNCRNA